MFYKAKGPKGDIIEVTSKTYRVLYESMGYVLVEDKEEPVIKENLKTDDEKPYEDMSVKELKSLLDEREIPYKGNDKKEKLIELIEE